LANREQWRAAIGAQIAYMFSVWLGVKYWRAGKAKAMAQRGVIRDAYATQSNPQVARHTAEQARNSARRGIRASSFLSMLHIGPPQ
jgi:hypothetical protein